MTRTKRPLMRLKARFIKALNGYTICMIFYLKAHRQVYRDKLNIDVKQLHSESEERLAQLRKNPDLLLRLPHRTMPALKG